MTDPVERRLAAIMFTDLGYAALMAASEAPSPTPRPGSNPGALTIERREPFLPVARRTWEKVLI